MYCFQVIFVLCAALGSYLAREVTDPKEPLYKGNDITALQGFFGGFLLVFGARMAGGCTSGHGISGVGHLCMRSILGIASMFAGAIAVGKFVVGKQYIYNIDIVYCDNVFVFIIIILPIYVSQSSFAA
jgi:uncharacterized membrane protein YedE/YeeE